MEIKLSESYPEKMGEVFALLAVAEALTAHKARGNFSERDLAVMDLWLKHTNDLANHLIDSPKRTLFSFPFE